MSKFTYDRWDHAKYLEEGKWKCGQAPTRKFFVEQLPDGKWGVFEEYDD